MKLGMQVSLGPGHIVLDGDPAPLPKGAEPPIFGLCIVANRLDGSRCRLVRRYMPPPRRHCVKWGRSPPPQGGGTVAPNFRPMSIVTKRSHESRCHLVGR